MNLDYSRAHLQACEIAQNQEKAMLENAFKRSFSAGKRGSSRTGWWRRLTTFSGMHRVGFLGLPCARPSVGLGWSLWVPSNSGYSMILWYRKLHPPGRSKVWCVFLGRMEEMERKTCTWMVVLQVSITGRRKVWMVGMTPWRFSLFLGHQKASKGAAQEGILHRVCVGYWVMARKHMDVAEAKQV